MEEVLERGIVRCFPENECYQNIVRREFLKLNQSEEQTVVPTLAFMSIKTIMHREMMSDEADIYSQYIYKLIFEETIENIKEFCEDEPVCENSSSDQKKNKLDEIGRRKAQIRQMRSDGPFMYALMSQEIPRLYDGNIRIILAQNTVQICVDYQCMAEIPHRNGSEFDTYYANKFARMLMSKYPLWVSIVMNGEGLSDDLLDADYMDDYVNDLIIEKLPRVIPPEGWEKYISNERPVYLRYMDYLDDKIYYRVLFKTHTAYFSDHFNQFWGYIGED